MQAIVEVLKETMRLGSVELWLLVLLVGLALLTWRRSRAWARTYVAVVLVAFWLLSTPAVAEWLASATDGGYVAIAKPEDARGATTIVVLGGGAFTFHVGRYVLSEPAGGTPYRVIEAARIYRMLDRPSIVLMGGPTFRQDPAARPESDAMAGAILALGVPIDRLVFENRSKTTREQAVEFKRMYAGHEAEPFVLVTSPTHIARSMGAFRAVGLNPIASPSALTSDGERARWLPSNDALTISDSIVYDTAARLYYWGRGWLSR
jgi:uncharacterized SAM-binding protein YcdF (DUF218 family)